MTTSKKFAGWLTGTVKVLIILFFFLSNSTQNGQKSFEREKKYYLSFSLTFYKVTTLPSNKNIAVLNVQIEYSLIFSVTNVTGYWSLMHCMARYEVRSMKSEEIARLIFDHL